MGRHSRRGLAARGDTGDSAARRGPQRTDGTPSTPGAGAPDGPTPGSRTPDGGATDSGATGHATGNAGAARGGRPGPGTVPERELQGREGRIPGPGPARPSGPRSFPDGTPAGGVPRLPDGTPARGIPRVPDGTPAHGMPRLPDGTSAQGTPRVRGRHPEQREPGGGWGRFGGAAGAARTAGATGPAEPSIPRQRYAPPDGTAPGSGTAPESGSRKPSGAGPRQEYLDAFDAPGGEDTGSLPAPRARKAGAPRTPKAAQIPQTEPVGRAGRFDPYASVTEWPPGTGTGLGVPNDGDGDGAAPTGEPAPGKGAKGRAYTGIAAAAVTTVLAIVVAGQVADGRDGTGTQARSATDQARDARDAGSDAGEPAVSSSPSVASLTYEQKMDTKYVLSAAFKGPGTFDAVPGVDKAPGKGRKYTYRVDVERGLGLDGALFAEAVQKTLNDNRSWSHNGARTFERTDTGKPDFVITLASPGTTAVWCAKSGLDTTEDNVSCDSASTERVMINAYRWAQGSKTYGDEIHAYRQMLINHEVGHRLGYHHVTCEKDGEPAPVMQQQTKFLDHDGIHCLPNPWAYPEN
ncbi:DUF3152 domain-containing protein [Streptomyces sp. NPDC047000]|uniref:DUF3152 domain-containing protein n=1 Tax=Streptomyces sp. NPDC047000 TaxID=3155474 RepID=UPI0033DE427B